MNWPQPVRPRARVARRRDGFSAFVRADGAVYHTYSTHARGLEFLMGYYPILDRAPKGRDEGGSSEFWIRRRDEYDPDEER